MLSEREKSIVVALAEIYVGDAIDGERQIGRVGEILAITDDAKIGQLRHAFSVVDSRLTGLLTTGRFESFVGAPHDRREKRLRTLGRSNVALVRKMYVALQRLSHGAYYSDALRYDEVGYPGPLPFVTSDARKNS